MPRELLRPRRYPRDQRLYVPVPYPVRGILTTWGEIAAYLGISVSLAMRWHRYRPMPISRIGRHVRVPRLAIDFWVASAPKRPRQPNGRVTERERLITGYM